MNLTQIGNDFFIDPKSVRGVYFYQGKTRIIYKGIDAHREVTSVEHFTVQQTVDILNGRTTFAKVNAELNGTPQDAPAGEYSRDAASNYTLDELRINDTSTG